MEWAKSHRPTHRLFQPAVFPSAGGDGIGEIFYRVSSATLPRLVRMINEAEPETLQKFNEHTQRMEPHPRRVRSEVGAIRELTLPEEADRRSFSAKEALTWFQDGRSGKVYLLDLFNLPKSLGLLLNAQREDQVLYETRAHGVLRARARHRPGLPTRNPSKGQNARSKLKNLTNMRV